MSATRQHMERVAQEMLNLLKNGKFTKHEIDFMEKFLTKALAATRKMQKHVKVTEEAEDGT